MKIAWLVWRYEDTEQPEFCKEEPSWCFRKVQIVYTEVID